MTWGFVGSSFFKLFKKITLARLFPINFYLNILVEKTFSLKLKCYSLQYCWKLNLLCIFRITASENHVWKATFPWNYSCRNVQSTSDITNDINISNKKRFHDNLFKVNKWIQILIKQCWHWKKRHLQSLLLRLVWHMSNII